MGRVRPRGVKRALSDPAGSRCLFHDAHCCTTRLSNSVLSVWSCCRVLPIVLMRRKPAFWTPSMLWSLLPNQQHRRATADRRSQSWVRERIHFGLALGLYLLDTYLWSSDCADRRFSGSELLPERAAVSALQLAAICIGTMAHVHVSSVVHGLIVSWSFAHRSNRARSLSQLRGDLLRYPR